MAESFNVLKRVASFSISPEEPGYTKVILYAGVDEDGNAVTYEAGDDTGKALEIKNDFATPAMAANILATIRGFRYQPFSAEDAQVDPSAELGDAVTINGVYGGIYRKKLKFGRQALSSLSAPGSTEIEHAFNLETASDRTFSRFVKSTRSMITQTNQRITLSVEQLEEADAKLKEDLEKSDASMRTEYMSLFDIQAKQISAKVESRTGQKSNSFSWVLTDSDWTLYSGLAKSFFASKDKIEMYAGGKPVVTVNSSGLTVDGKIQANSLSTLDGTFKGNVSENAYGTFTGTTWAGSLDYGGNAGYFDGYGLSDSTVGTGPLSWGVNSSLSNGDDSYDTLFGYSSTSANIQNLFIGRMWLDDYQITRGYVTDKNGGRIPVLRWL